MNRRFLALPVIALGLIALSPTPSSATSLPLDRPAASAPVIEVAGPRCGRHAHYVRGHRSRINGRWVRGHCVRNHR